MYNTNTVCTLVYNTNTVCTLMYNTNTVCTLVYNTNTVCTLMYNTNTVCTLVLGAIYLKNMIMKYWKVREAVEGAEPPYFLPDDVKEVVRNNIVESIIQTPILVG